MKPFMILLSGQISLEIHQSGHEVGGNGGLESSTQNAFGHR
jgi:hypothetical protein